MILLGKVSLQMGFGPPSDLINNDGNTGRGDLNVNAPFGEETASEGKLINTWKWNLSIWN